MTNGQLDIARMLRTLVYADQTWNVSKTCRNFGISRDTFYRWKQDYHQDGVQGLINSKPRKHNPKPRTPLETEEKILYALKIEDFDARMSGGLVVYANALCREAADG